MYSALNHIAAFFSVVVVSCAHPDNWNNCKDPHIWLYPELERGLEIWLDDEHTHLYQDERDYLNN
tara:strand:- start:888 stop:1082 length:195 start_codon:yes stop_codon:yes gene_type:complete